MVAHSGEQSIHSVKADRWAFRTVLQHLISSLPVQFSSAHSSQTSHNTWNFISRVTTVIIFFFLNSLSASDKSMSGLAWSLD